ncbi:reverse transcriptase domain-containing protein [Tanacetum coccineum]
MAILQMGDRHPWPIPRGTRKSEVERANNSLGEGIKARLGEGNKNWVEEVSHVLWAHRTMIKTSNGDTLFSLISGIEVVIPVEIGMPLLRPSHEGYRNTIELPKGNNVVPLRSDTIRIRSIWEDLTTRFLAQFFPPRRTAKPCNDILIFQQHQGESLFEA